MATLPPGEDPDSMLVAGKREELLGVLDRAQPIFDFFVLAQVREHGRDPAGISRMAKHLKELAEVVRNRMVLDVMIDRAAQLLQVDRRNLSRQMAQTRKTRESEQSPKVPGGPEVELVEWLYRDTDLADIVIERGGEDLVDDQEIKGLLRGFISTYEAGGDVVQNLLEADISQGLKDRLMRVAMGVNPEGTDTSFALNQVLITLESHRKQKAIDSIGEEMKTRTELGSDRDEARRLEERLKKLKRDREQMLIRLKQK